MQKKIYRNQDKVSNHDILSVFSKSTVLFEPKITFKNIQTDILIKSSKLRLYIRKRKKEKKIKMETIKKYEIKVKIENI